MFFHQKYCSSTVRLLYLKRENSLILVVQLALEKNHLAPKIREFLDDVQVFALVAGKFCRRGAGGVVQVVEEAIL